MSLKLMQTQVLNDEYKKRAPVLPDEVDNAMTDLAMASIVTRITMKVKPCVGKEISLIAYSKVLLCIMISQLLLNNLLKHSVQLYNVLLYFVNILCRL